MKPTLIGFEKKYLDGSGVEYSVQYDASRVFDEIELRRIHTIGFPLDQLDWLIECLQSIRDALGNE